MTTLRHYGGYTAARANLRRVLDSAHEGVLTTIDRDKERFVVIAADSLRAQLAQLLRSGAIVVAEGGGWAAMIPGLPVHGEGDTFTAAIDDLVLALRDYAEDWNDRLRLAPSHQHHRSLVQLVELSNDGQLRHWLVGVDTGDPEASDLHVATPHSTDALTSV